MSEKRKRNTPKKVENEEEELDYSDIQQDTPDVVEKTKSAQKKSSRGRILKSSKLEGFIYESISNEIMRNEINKNQGNSNKTEIQNSTTGGLESKGQNEVNHKTKQQLPSDGLVITNNDNNEITTIPETELSESSHVSSKSRVENMPPSGENRRMEIDRKVDNFEGQIKNKSNGKFDKDQNELKLNDFIAEFSSEEESDDCEKVVTPRFRKEYTESSSDDSDSDVCYRRKKRKRRSPKKGSAKK